MRHFRSILYAVVLAPVVWVLAGSGLSRALAGRASDGPTVESLTGLGLLLLGGLAYGIWVFAPVSPIGPSLAGLAFLGVGVWAVEWPAGYAGAWPGALTKSGFDLSRPGYGLAVLLGVPLLLTAVSVRRWSGHQPVMLPFVGAGRQAPAVPATPFAALFPARESFPAQESFPAPVEDGESTTVLRAPASPRTAEPTLPADATTILPIMREDGEATTVLRAPRREEAVAEQAPPSEEPTDTLADERPTETVSTGTKPSDDEPTDTLVDEPPTEAVRTVVKAEGEQPTDTLVDEPPTEAVGTVTMAEGEEPTEALADERPTETVETGAKPTDDEPTDALGDEPPTETVGVITEPTSDEPTDTLADERPTENVVDEPAEQVTEAVRLGGPTEVLTDEQPTGDVLEEPTISIGAQEEPTAVIEADEEPSEGVAPEPIDEPAEAVDAIDEEKTAVVVLVPETPAGEPAVEAPEDRPVAVTPEEQGIATADEQPAAETPEEATPADPAEDEPVTETPGDETAAGVLDEQPATETAFEEPVAETPADEAAAEMQEEQPAAATAADEPAAGTPEVEDAAATPEERPTAEATNDEPVAEVGESDEPTAPVEMVGEVETAVFALPQDDAVEADEESSGRVETAAEVDTAEESGEEAAPADAEESGEEAAQADAEAITSESEPSTAEAGVEDEPFRGTAEVDSAISDEEFARAYIAEQGLPEDVRVIVVDEDGDRAVMVEETTYLLMPAEEDDPTRALRLNATALEDDGERTQVIRPIGYEPGQTTRDLGIPGDRTQVIWPAANRVPGERTVVIGQPGEQTRRIVPSRSAGARPGENGERPDESRGRPSEDGDRNRPGPDRPGADRPGADRPGADRPGDGKDWPRGGRDRPGEPAGLDDTQVIRLSAPADDGERTQVIRGGLVTPPSGDIQPSPVAAGGDRTEPDTEPVTPADVGRAARRKATPPRSIVGAESPNFADDPTGRLVPPPSMADEPTRTMTVMNIERPPDEQPEIPAQRKPGPDED